MNFEDLRERVKGGKLDPLSKMGKSKLKVKKLRHTIVKTISIKPEEKFYNGQKAIPMD